MNKLDTLISCLPDAPYKQHLTDEIASLREQLSNMMRLVASVEKERDELLAEMRANPNEYPNLLRINREHAEYCDKQLVAMTKERDDARRTAEYWKAEHLAGNEILAATEALCQQYREALEKLAKLGNGDYYGTSIGNSIAYSALTLPSPTAALNNAIAEEHADLIELLEQATSYTCCSAYSPSLTREINAALAKVGEKL